MTTDGSPLSSVPSTDFVLSPNDVEGLLLDCRFGELDSVQSFTERFGVYALTTARDERGNGVLHMCAANGHHDILSYILSLPGLTPSLLISGNDAGNTPLHWACLNTQLECAKCLVAFKPTSLASGNSSLPLGAALILARNNAGQTPLGEAERTGWDEGARWLVSVMDLQSASESSSAIETEEAGDDGPTYEKGESEDTGVHAYPDEGQGTQTRMSVCADRQQ